MARGDRAINMALRVLGIGEAERDFKRVGDAGSKSFAQIEKAANGAAQEVSEYTARLRRVTTAAHEAFNNLPQLNKGSDQQVRQNRAEFVLGAIKAEQENILKGLPEGTENLQRLGGAAEETGISLTRMRLLAAAGAGAVVLLAKGAYESLQAFEEHQRALEAFNAELALTGNYTGASSRQIEEMSRRIVDSTLQTEKATLSAAQQLAKVHDLTAAGLEEALQASAAYADAVGRELPDIIESHTGPVLQALADRDMKALVKATEDLEASLRAQILTLAEAGRTADAQRVFLDGLREAAGDGPGGLTRSTNTLTDAWERFKQSAGEDISGPTGAILDFIASRLDNLRLKAEETRLGLLGVGIAGAFPSLAPYLNKPKPNFTPDTGFAGQELARLRAGEASKVNAAFEEKYNARPERKGRGGKSEAQREAERLEREAESARKSADRVAEANDDVVESYRRRAEEAQARIGLEGAALEAFERNLAIEEAARKINRDEIEKEVVARRAAAAAAGLQFDEAGATRAATVAVEEKATAIRGLAADYVDANAEIEEFNRKQKQAERILAQLVTPFEAINNEVERAIEALQSGKLTPEGFDSYMDLLAQDLDRARYQLDESAQAWSGYGRAVGETLSDLIIRGGSARDVLQSLVQMTLERKLEEQLVNPVADFIDGLTGNNVDKNVAAARADLPNASQFAGAQVEVLGASAQRAAAALNQIPAALGNPVVDLASESDAAAAALGGLVPVTGQYAGALNSAISLLSSGSGGGGGLAGALKFGLGLFGGGGAGPSSSLVSNVSSAIAANPAIFAGGTESVPKGRMFTVGENGRETMEYLGDGRLRVHSNESTRRMVDQSGGATVVNQNFSIPSGADPRRTQSSVNRGTQQALGVARRKNLA